MLDTYTLEQFEGPLDFLWQLLLKEEVKICEISLKSLLEQYLDKQNSLEQTAEFTYWMAHLVWLKTQELLPKEEWDDTELRGLDEQPIQTLHHLIEYCRLKEAAKILFKLEEGQGGVSSRGMVENHEMPKKSGVEHLSLEDLAKLFRELAQKANPQPKKIYEETFRVSDKVQKIREILRADGKIPFHTLFSLDLSKGELIVTFLALLEMMKLSELSVIRTVEAGIIEIVQGGIK